MKDSSTDKILERIGALIRKGENARSQRWVERPVRFPSKHTLQSGSPRGKSVPLVEPGPFQEWRTAALSLIEAITPPDSIYRRDFEEKVNSACIAHLESGIGILRALKTDVEQGYLSSYETLIAAEVFADFLEMAEQLLHAHCKDPAAFLVGAVLEDGLRRMCKSNGISVKGGDDISSLNKKLADKGLYNRVMQRQIQAWKGIRDSADHGKFMEYKPEDVKSMLEGVRRFLGENIE